jgi:hypothetical protein
MYDAASPANTDPSSSSLFGASSLFAPSAPRGSVDMPRLQNNGGGGGYASLDPYDSTGASGLSSHFGDMDLTSDASAAAAAAAAAYGAFGAGGAGGNGIGSGVGGPSGQSSDPLGSFIGQDFVAQVFGGNGGGQQQHHHGQQAISTSDLSGGGASLLSVDLLGALDGTMASNPNPMPSQPSSTPYHHLQQQQQQQMTLQQGMSQQMLASMGGGGVGGNASSMLGLDPSARVFQMDPATATNITQAQGLNLPTDSASLFAPPSNSSTSSGAQTQQYRSLW